MHVNVLRTWVREHRADPAHSCGSDISSSQRQTVWRIASPEWLPQNGVHLGCISRRNAQTAASSAAARFHKQLPRNHLPEMTRAGLEPATYGLKERPEFIPRARPSTSKFVVVLVLYGSGVRPRFSEFLGVPCTSRDKWGATRVQSSACQAAAESHRPFPVVEIPLRRSS